VIGAALEIILFVDLPGHERRQVWIVLVGSLGLLRLDSATGEPADNGKGEASQAKRKRRREANVKKGRAIGFVSFHGNGLF
jgi:hypothetical protein